MIVSLFLLCLSCCVLCIVVYCLLAHCYVWFVQYLGAGYELFCCCYMIVSLFACLFVVLNCLLELGMVVLLFVCISGRLL